MLEQSVSSSKVGDNMAEKEMMQRNIEEFSRLQDYMIEDGKDAKAYKIMLKRYLDLKAILQASGINLTDIDRIKE